MTPAGRSALLVAAAAATCFAASAATQGDPLFLVETAGAVVVVIWLGIAAVLIVRSAALARELTGAAVRRSLAGVECRVIPDRRPHAFVAGVWRPSVFVSTGALDVLTAEELRAVVLHEAHHARTFAPVRAAFVTAWQGAARHVPWLGALLATRLAAIEIDADRYALAHGVGRRHLAWALLKLETSAGGTGFGGGSDRRLRMLLDRVASPPEAAPVEWLPLLVVVGLAVGCRLAGTAVGV